MVSFDRPAGADFRDNVLSMLFNFGMTKCKSVSTPLDRNVKLHPDSGMACDPKRFSQIVGSLIYLTITRPNLNYPVRLISQFMAQPAMDHLKSVQCILKYVSDTKDRGLLYQTSTVEQLISFTNANWPENAGNRRSTSGFAFSFRSTVIA